MNNNSAHWIREGKRQGVDVQFLFQDKTKLFERLEHLGLPTPRRHLFTPASLSPERIAPLFQGDRYFCRLVPFHADQERPYHLGISTAEEFWNFAGEYDLSSFREIQLIEKGYTQYTGAIVAGNTSLVVELVEGDGPKLFHGKETPVHATVDLDGIMHYSILRFPSSHERQIIFQAIKLVGGPKNPFPGYYEFEYMGQPKERLIFRNYQSPASTYGKLEA